MAGEGGPRLGLTVMAKAPIPGEAKTRLGSCLGHAVAAAVYQAFLLDTVAVVDDVAARAGAVTKLLTCPDHRHAARLRALVDASWTVVEQTREGLMGGIADAFDAAFRRDADLVVVSDADSPLSLFEHLETCIAEASTSDVALGPTTDGGYYLVTSRRAVRSLLPELFLGKRYESTTICAETARQAELLELSVSFGPTGFDVDTRDDLRALATLLNQAPVKALAHTRAALTRLDETLAVATG